MKNMVMRSAIFNIYSTIGIDAIPFPYFVPKGTNYIDIYSAEHVCRITISKINRCGRMCTSPGNKQIISFQPCLFCTVEKKLKDQKEKVELEKKLKTPATLESIGFK